MVRGCAGWSGGCTLVQNQIISFINYVYDLLSLIRPDLGEVVRFLARNLILEAFL